MMKTYSRKRKEPASSPPPSSPHTPLQSSSPNRPTIANSSSPPECPQYPTTPTAPRKKQKKAIMTPSNAKKPAPKLTQMHLFFGNSARTHCKECGMSFVKVDANDVELHKKFHKRAFDGREWAADFDQNVVLQSSKPGQYVVRVDSKSKPAARRAVEDLVSLVNTELSAPPENYAWKHVPNKGAAFVYIAAKRAVGIVVVERVDECSWMNVKTGELMSDETSHKPIMGISRIFTARNHRQKHIASALLEIARKKFVYGMEVSKKEVAWSQPSASGGIVADKWCGQDFENGRRILVYIE